MSDETRTALSRNGTYMHMDRVAQDGVLRPRFDPSIEIAMASLPWD